MKPLNSLQSILKNLLPLAVLCTAGLMGLRCGNGDSGGAIQSQVQLKEFPEADLSSLGETVRQQIKSHHLRIKQLEASEEVDVPALVAAYGRLGKLYHAYDCHSQAQFCYQKAIELEPQTFQWHYLLARVLQAKFLHDAAKVQFEKALQLDEFHVPSLLALGEFSRRRGQIKEATTYFNNALLLEKNCVFARLGLAQIAIEAKEFQKAITLMEEAIRLQPHGTELHYTAAMAYRGLGNTEKAQMHLELKQKYDEVTYFRDPDMDDVHKLANQDKGFLERGNRALAANNFEAAVKYFHNAVGLNPGSGETRLKLASAYLRLGELDKAREEFLAADRLRPGNFHIAYNLAGIAMEQNDLEEAENQLRRAIEQNEDFAEAHLQLADLLLIKDQFDQALTHYQKVVTLDDKNPAARVGRALSLIHLNRHQEARQTLEADLIQFPSHVSLGVLYVRILAASPDDRVRDGKLAVELIETMAKAGTNYEILVAGAMAYAEVNRFDMAIDWQNRALALARKDRPNHIANSESLLSTYQAGEPCRQPLPRG